MKRYSPNHPAVRYQLDNYFSPYTNPPAKQSRIIRWWRKVTR